MESIAEPIFKLIPVKLLLLIGVIFIWYKLQKQAPSSQKILFRFAVSLVIITLTLAMLSIKKLYPYGALTDILVIFLGVLVSSGIASQMRKYGPRFFAAFTPLLVISCVPLFYALHFLVVGGAVNYDSFIAIFQSNSAEAGEYVASFTSIFTLGVLLFSITVLIWISHKFSKENSPNKTQNPTFKSSLLLLLILIIIPKEKGLFSYPLISFNNYLHELEGVKSNQNKMQQSLADGNFEALKNEHREIHVVVIGESLNKHHMGLYGYDKDTTPLMNKLAEQGSLIHFPYSYANYPGTMAALSWALSASNQHNQRPYMNSVGLVDVYNRAGFKSHWIGNQPISNSYDMLLGFIAKAAQEVTITFDIEFHGMSLDNHKPDGVLLPHIEKALQQADDQNQVLFVHLMGNHTNYCERYPAEYEKYKMSWLEATWTRIIKGGLGHSKECYDNSILYNDFVISEIIRLIDKEGDGKAASLVYFADHSQDINRGVGHSSANYSFDMVESPMLVWVSDEYQQQYPDKVASLHSNTTELNSNDFIFDTAIGLANITLSDDHYCKRCDLSSSAYELKDDEAMTMHGTLPYVSQDNPWAQVYLEDKKSFTKNNDLAAE